MSLLDMLSIPEDVVKERDYYELFESHVTYLKNLSSTQVTSITEHQASIYQGDFYGLLYKLGVEKKYHYPIMRVNGLLASSNYDGKTTEIILPSLSEMNAITTIYSSNETT